MLSSQRSPAVSSEQRQLAFEVDISLINAKVYGRYNGLNRRIQGRCAFHLAMALQMDSFGIALTLKQYLAIKITFHLAWPAVRIAVTFANASFSILTYAE